jgi:hypothetical protein
MYLFPEKKNIGGTIQLLCKSNYIPSINGLNQSEPETFSIFLFFFYFNNQSGLIQWQNKQQKQKATTEKIVTLSSRRERKRKKKREKMIKIYCFPIVSKESFYFLKNKCGLAWK